MVKLGGIAEFQYGYTESGLDSGDLRFIRITDIDDFGCIVDRNKKYINNFNESYKYLLQINDILVSRTGSYGKTTIFTESEPSIFASYLIRIKFIIDNITPKYYWYFAQTDIYWKQAHSLVGGTSQLQFNANVIKNIQIPLPPLSIQQEIVEKLDEEQEYIKQTQNFIAKQKQKITLIVSKLWS